MDQTPRRRRRRPDPDAYPSPAPKEPTFQSERVSVQPDAQPDEANRNHAAGTDPSAQPSASHSDHNPKPSATRSGRQSPQARLRLNKAQQRYGVIFLVSTVVLAVCLYNVLNYTFDYLRSLRFSAELRDAYLSADSDAPLDLDTLYAEAIFAEMNPQDEVFPYATDPAGAVTESTQIAGADASGEAIPGETAFADTPPSGDHAVTVASAATQAPAMATPAPAVSAAPLLADANASSGPTLPTPVDFSAYASTMTTAPPDNAASTSANAAVSPVSLPAVPYPTNPSRTISSRFAKIRRQNSEIIGWLTLEGLLSEAVVQRDNSYYLTRDYQGYHNVNGAIFLEERVDLSTRPYTLTLYGHNMKTGAMFGCLRNYEDIGYYRRNPFIEFDSIYEDGKYVIFAISEVSIDSRNSNYNGFFHLNSCSTAERKEIIDGLFKYAQYVCPIDVSVDDQLLLLVTCVGDDSSRRILAARRFRSNDTEGGLYVQAQKAHHR